MSEVRKNIERKKEEIEAEIAEKKNEILAELNLKPGELKAPSKLKLLFTIVDRNKAEFYKDVLEGFDVNLQIILYARGTAHKELFDLLNVEDSSKAILISAVKDEKVKEILEAYEDKYFNTRGGKGLAFTVSFDSMIGVMAYRLMADIREDR